MNIDKVITKLNTLHPDIPVFSSEITKEEVDSSSSYFIYRDSHQLSRGETGRGLYRKFFVFYVTAERREIDIVALSDELQDGTGLYFLDSEEDFGKMADEDRSMMMVTLNFRYMVRKC